MKIGMISVDNDIFEKFHKKCIEFGTKISKGREKIPARVSKRAFINKIILEICLFKSLEQNKQQCKSRVRIPLVCYDLLARADCLTWQEVW